MVNQIGTNEPVAANQATSSTAPAAKTSSTATVRRVCQFGSPVPSSGPSSPTSPVSFSGSEVRMVLFHDFAHEWTQVSNNDADQKWVIVDSGSDVSLLPESIRPTTVPVRC